MTLAQRSKGSILDVYGAFTRRLDGDGWLAVADLIRLLREVGLEEQAVRSAASRMKQTGLLVRSRRDRGVGYAPSAELAEALRAGDRRILGSQLPARLEDGWVVVVFSVPETERHRRHQLRCRLVWLGLGNLAPGVWLGPARLSAETEATVRSLGLTGQVSMFEATYHRFGDLATLVRQCWDLDGLAELYQRFLAEHEPVLTRWATSPGDDAQAFADYLLAVSHWRTLPFLDPGLPVDLLPEAWAGRSAADLFWALHERLDGPALSFAGSLAAYERVPAHVT